MSIKLENKINSIKSKIQLEVHAQNDFFRIIKAELENVLPQLDQYIGKKIITNDGLSKRFVVNFLRTKPVGLPGCGATFNGCYLTSKYGELRMIIRVCYNHADGSHYVDREIGLGALQNGDTLLNVTKMHEIISDYGFDKVLNADLEIENVKEYIRINEEMETKLRELRNQIGVSYDLYRNV